MFTFLFHLHKAPWCAAQLNICKYNIKKGNTMYLLEYYEATCLVNRTHLSKTCDLKKKGSKNT